MSIDENIDNIEALNVCNTDNKTEREIINNNENKTEDQSSIPKAKTTSNSILSKKRITKSKKNDKLAKETILITNQMNKNRQISDTNSINNINSEIVTNSNISPNLSNVEINSDKNNFDNLKISSEDDLKIIMKKQNELFAKEKEYQSRISQLKAKLTEIENSYNEQISRYKNENDDKSKKVSQLTNTNNAIKETIESLQKRFNEIIKKQNNKNNNSLVISKTESDENTENINILNSKKKEIQKKQNLILALTKENKIMKKSLEREATVEKENNLNDNLYMKEQEITNLKYEIKKYEPIVKEHNKICIQEINELNKELENLQNGIEKNKSLIRDKNKNYVLLQCKFSLADKNNEKSYDNLKLKKRYKEPNDQDQKSSDKNTSKHTNNYLPEINNYSYISKQIVPKIDTNSENRVMAVFTQAELEEISKLFMNYADQEKYENFLEKILEIEKGGNNEELLKAYKQRQIKLKEAEELVNVQNLKNESIEDVNTEVKQKIREVKKTINELNRKIIQNKKNLEKQKSMKRYENLKKMIEKEKEKNRARLNKNKDKKISNEKKNKKEANNNEEKKENNFPKNNTEKAKNDNEENKNKEEINSNGEKEEYNSKEEVNNNGEKEENNDETNNKEVND